MKKFLICEDDQDMIDFLNIYLNSKGYQFLIVEEGNRVLSTLKKDNFSFLLLDLNLSDMHGKEVIRQIRQDPTLKNIPIIIFSASIKTQKLLDELNADGYIEKPFNLNELEELVSKWI